MRRRYRFRHEWDAPAAMADVYAVLHELVDYPAWWPHLRNATKLDEDNVALEAHALLPYSLHMTMHRVRDEPEKGLLETRIQGDLRGWARWTLRPTPVGTHICFEEDVILDKPMLRAVEAVVWPLYRLNHDFTMRNAVRLFTTFLSGFMLGKRTAVGDGSAVTARRGV